MMVRSRVRMAWSLQRLGRREAIFHFWSLLVGGTAGHHLLKRQELHSSFKKNRINSHWLLVRITNQRLRPPLNIQRFFLQPQFSEVKTDRAVTDFDLWCCSSPSFPCSSTSFPYSSSLCCSSTCFSCSSTCFPCLPPPSLALPPPSLAPQAQSQSETVQVFLHLSILPENWNLIFWRGSEKDIKYQ